MSQFRCSEKCRDTIRMGPYAFTKLCEILWGIGHLQDTKNSSVEDQVAEFLYILVHNERIRTISFFFCHSSETISLYFHNVLRAVIYLKNQNFFYNWMGQRFPHKYEKVRFYPYFKVNIFLSYYMEIFSNMSKELLT